MVEVRLGVVRSPGSPELPFLFIPGEVPEEVELELLGMEFYYDKKLKGFKGRFKREIIEKLKNNKIYNVSKNVISKYNEEKEKSIPKRYFPIGELKTELLPFQREGRDFILKSGSCICADQMGLGKSVQSIAAAEFWGAKCLIVSRASLIKQWGKEIEKFTDSSFEIIAGSPSKRTSLWRSAIETPSHYAIVSYDTLKDDINPAQYYLMDGGMAVYDKITMLKNYKTARTKEIKKLQPRVIIGLTGTPYENHLDEYYQIFSIVKPGLLPPYQQYKEMFTIRDERTIRTASGRTFKIEKIIKEINLDVLKKMVEPAMIRRLRKEVLTLPPSEVIVRQIGMSRLQREIEAFLMKGARKYEELVLPFFTFGLENALSPCMLDSTKIPDYIDLFPLIEKLEEIQVLQDDNPEEYKRVAITPRLEEIESIIEESGDDTKIAIYSRFTKALKLIDSLVLQEMGVKTAYFTGFARESKEFLEGGANVLLMSGAGAYGVNLQEACHIMILFDKPFNPAVLEQVKGRIDRIGQKSSIQYYEFESESLIERKAFDIIKKKGDTSEILLARSVM